MFQVIADRKKIIQNSKNHEELSEEDKLLGKKRRLAFLDLLLQQNMETNEWTDKELREEVDTFMFAVSSQITHWESKEIIINVILVKAMNKQGKIMHQLIKT